MVVWRNKITIKLALVLSAHLRYWILTLCVTLRQSFLHASARIHIFQHTHLPLPYKMLIMFFVIL